MTSIRKISVAALAISAFIAAETSAHNISETKPLRLPDPLHSYSAESLALAKANFPAPGDASAAMINPSAMTRSRDAFVMAGYTLGYFETSHGMKMNHNHGPTHFPQLYATAPLTERLWFGYAMTAEKAMFVETAPIAYGRIVWVAKPSLAIKATESLSLGAALRVGYGYSYPDNWLSSKRVEPIPAPPHDTNYEYYWFHADGEARDYGCEFSATWRPSESVAIALAWSDTLDENEVNGNTRLGVDWRVSDAWRWGCVIQKEKDLTSTNYRSFGIGATRQINPSMKMMMGGIIGTRFPNVLGKDDYTLALGLAKTVAKTDFSLGFSYTDPYHVNNSTYMLVNLSAGRRF